MKIVENNVKCCETIIFDQKSYLKTTKLPSNFVRVFASLSVFTRINNRSFYRKYLAVKFTRELSLSLTSVFSVKTVIN